MEYKGLIFRLENVGVSERLSLGRNGGRYVVESKLVQSVPSRTIVADPAFRPLWSEINHY